ncbi:MAG: hypothetical protein ACYC3I_16145 [Gemmataceae bacterium]
MSAFYETDIERSLHLQNRLDLYPLHKRVLGLIERTLLPKVEATFLARYGRLPEAAKGPSGLWTVSFTGAQDKKKDKKTGKVTSYDPLTGATLAATWEADGKKATLETEGNWLFYASAHDSTRATWPVNLVNLLDDLDGLFDLNGLLPRMSSATEVNGFRVTLNPGTPEVHARQLAALADRSNRNAECMTLYLGKLALMLRNAIEHGTDEVVKEGLLIDASGYWNERGGVLRWLRTNADQLSWKLRTQLPSALPDAANSFLLTPASLKRCLVLLSLVLRAGFSHLQLP